MLLLSNYFHTLRYLKPQQIYRRVLFRVSKPCADQRPAPLLRTFTGRLISIACQRVSLIDAETFFFLNQSGRLSCFGWDGTSKTDFISKLWRYNQHYFDDLNAVDSNQRCKWHRALLLRWHAENPPGIGVGWDPYPTSLRIVNWVKWHCSGNALPDVCVQSLAVQTRWLVRRIEWHILGNHLFANAKALCFAGLFFDGEEAEHIYNKGIKLIEREVVEQLCDDGGNFELSTMYHIIFLEDLLDLINIHRAYSRDLPVNVEKNIIPMLNWLQVMCHPDGEISFFNDAALGITPTVAEIIAYANRLGYMTASVKNGMVDLPESGYTRVAFVNAVALIDRAAVGPDFLPGHAHADTLSFELSLFGRRVIVNSGTSVYGTGEQRQKERGTATHSTVLIDQENSSEVWGGFRVARRAYVSERYHQIDGQTIRLVGCHDGYKRLEGKPQHCREWLFDDQLLLITDRITGKGRHQVVAVFPLHPDVTLQYAGPTYCYLMVDGKQVKIEFDGDGDGDGELEVVESAYHPEFGLSVDNNHLCYKVHADLPIEITTRISW